MAETKIEQRTASDIMQKHVVVIGPKDSLQEAMSLITENHVTGLPVLDNKDRCIGVISASDILGFQQGGAGVEANSDVAWYYDPEQERWESVDVGAFGRESLNETPVSEIMTRELVSVGPQTPVGAVAQLMEEQEIHRVLVVDEKKKLHGIVSAFDFVRLAASGM